MVAHQLLSAVGFCMCVAVDAAAATGPLPLIIDTDIGAGGCMDVDDVAALAVAHKLADDGAIDLLAVMQDTAPTAGVGVISVINTYYGRGDGVAIGAYKGAGLSARYSRRHAYTTELVENFPSPIKNASQVEDAVILYRRKLAAATDHSVVIVSIGLLVNLEGLFRSGADAASGLSGLELVRRKVARLVIMGGSYPTSGVFPRGCNFCGCAYLSPPTDVAASITAAHYVVAHLPDDVPTVFIGGEVGREVLSGGMLSTCHPATSPIRAAFETFQAGPNRPRFSWDPLAVLIAARGPATGSCALCTHCAGRNRVSWLSGTNAWVPSPTPTNQTYVVLNDGVAAGAALDELLCAAVPRDSTPEECAA